VIGIGKLFVDKHHFFGKEEQNKDCDWRVWLSIHHGYYWYYLPAWLKQSWSTTMSQPGLPQLLAHVHFHR
jgi:hypothetical protein